MSAKWEGDEVLERFREYLRIPSVHPDIDYTDCVKFVRKQADLLDLPVIVHELVPRKPVLVISWEGLEPESPAILLNSHMDVVPVGEEFWTYPPFEACISDDGFIYARGCQDMKGNAMVYIEAVRRLKKSGKRLKRTVHICFVPDEEIGSVDGMRIFSESEHFRQLNVGFGIDESVVSPVPDVIMAFNGERTSRQIKVTCKGEPGHGSLLTNDTAGEKFHKIIDKFMTFRAQEKIKADLNTFIGDITTVNLTQVQGGVQVNVLPEELCATFDIRIPPHVDHDDFENMISQWCQDAGATFEYIVKNPEIKSTKLDGSEPFWNALKNAVETMGLSIDCRICPGATDARFVRQQGIPAINFTPFTNSPILLHCHNEKVHVDVFKRGIDIMEQVLEAVANV